MVYDKEADEWRPRWGYKVWKRRVFHVQRVGSDPMDGWVTEDKQLVVLVCCL